MAEGEMSLLKMKDWQTLIIACARAPPTPPAPAGGDRGGRSRRTRTRRSPPRSSPGRRRSRAAPCALRRSARASSPGGRAVFTITTSTGRPMVSPSSRTAVAGGEAGHAPPFGQQVRDQHDRALDLPDRLGAPLSPGRSASGSYRSCRDRRSPPRTGRSPRPRPAGSALPAPARATSTSCPAVCPASTSTSPRVRVPSRYSAQTLACSMLTGQTRPAQPSRPRSPSTAARKSPLYCCIIDSSRLPPVWPPSRCVFERRQPRQQHAARLALVARQRQRALQHVARRQHAELVAQHARAPAAVEHRDDGVDGEPRVGLQSAEQTRQSGAAAEAADVEGAQLHGTADCNAQI